MPRDLFGDVPVYTYDVDAWLRAVPKIQPGTARAAHYVHAYNVIEKIKRAKLDGTFEASAQSFSDKNARPTRLLGRKHDQHHPTDHRHQPKQLKPARTIRIVKPTGANR